MILCNFLLIILIKNNVIFHCIDRVTNYLIWTYVCDALGCLDYRNLFKYDMHVVYLFICKVLFIL